MVATTVVARMQEPLSGDLVAALLETAPTGDYLLEQRGRWRILWRLSDGEPPDGALEPATGWALADDAAVVA